MAASQEIVPVPLLTTPQTSHNKSAGDPGLVGVSMTPLPEASGKPVVAVTDGPPKKTVVSPLTTSLAGTPPRVVQMRVGVVVTVTTPPLADDMPSA